VLVEAIKELSAEVEHLRSQLMDTKSDNTSVQNKTSGTSLRQNYPNPSNQVTTIEYVLADEVADAALYVFDLNGKQVAVYNQLMAGGGKVTISASQLPAGLYHYSLVTDGTIIDTKKMLLTN
jgi:predicted phage tail protein